jgi:integrase/recombinase XerD
MGSIYLDNQSRNWKIKTDLNGKDTRIRLRAATDEEVLAWKNKVRVRPVDVVDLAKNHMVKTKVCTAKVDLPAAPPDDLLGFIDWFLIDYAKYRRPNSVLAITNILRHFRRYLGSTTLRVDEVTPATIEGYFDWRLANPVLKKPLKRSTVFTELTMMSGLFSAGVVEKKISNNPVKPVLKKLRPYCRRPETIKYLDPDQRRDFLIALKDAEHTGRIPARYADLYRVILATGLRVTAACNLDWSWINLNTWDLAVPPEFAKVKGIDYVTVVADIGQEVLNRLHKGSTKGLVFPSTNAHMAWDHAHKLGTFPHALRHSFGTAMTDAGQPIQITSGCMGHNSLATTQIYAKVRSEAKREAVGKLRLSI